MFGYAVANPDKLTQEQKERYRAVYCGICRAMGESRSFVHRVALTYDLVLLAMVLSAAGNKPYEEGETRCGVQPFSRHKTLRNDYTQFAADMNILLAYYNFLDDVKDEGGVLPAAQAALFRKEAEKLSEVYPDLSKTIEHCLTEISEAEKRDERDPDIPGSAFGDILGSIFAYQPLPCSEALYYFGFSLGKAIYFMDAAVDIKSDLKKKRYNPLIAKTAEERLALVEFQLADAMERYKGLPHGEDKDITDNILLSGIWTAYDSRVKNKNESFIEEVRSEE